jgi:hypothetical protein
MTGAVANPVIQKQAFRNQSPGWIGAVQIDAKGQDAGCAVEPDGIVWLSEAEQILTANAPKRYEDNPFIEQEMDFGVDEDGRPQVRRVVPLLPVTENRYVPAGDRPIPAHGMQVQPEVAEPEDAPDPEAVLAREQAVVQAASAGERPMPKPTRRAQAAVEAAEEHAAAPTPPEEHAETGAPVAPTQEPTEGEYAVSEEVGTPAAPAATAPEPYVPEEG